MKTRWRLGILVVALSCLTVRGADAAIITFDLETVPIGSSTNLPPGVSQTVSGVTATFSTSMGGYFITTGGALFFDLSQLSGNLLAPIGAAVIPLSVVFSQSVDSVSVDFATIEGHIQSQMLLEAFLGANLVGTASAAGVLIGEGTDNPDTPFPQGTVTFNAGGSLFDRILLTVPAQSGEPARAFLADTFVVNTVTEPPPPTPVPEPSGLVLLGAGLVACGLRRW